MAHNMRRLERAVQYLGCSFIAGHHQQLEAFLNASGMFPGTTEYNMKHLVYLCWGPLITFAAQVCCPKQRTSERPRDCVNVGRCLELIGPHFKAILGDDALNAQPTLVVCDWLAIFIYDFLGCDLDAESIRDVVSAAIPFTLESTQLSGFTLLVSGAFQQRLGPTLTTKLKRKALALALDLEDLKPEADFALALTKEVLNLRAPSQDDGTIVRRSSNDPRRSIPRLSTEIHKKQQITQSLVELAVKSKQALRPNFPAPWLKQRTSSPSAQAETSKRNLCILPPAALCAVTSSGWTTHWIAMSATAYLQQKQKGGSMEQGWSPTSRHRRNLAFEGCDFKYRSCTSPGLSTRACGKHLMYLQ